MKIRVKSLIVLFLIILITTFFVGCATIMHGTTQEVSITSSPEAADVTVKTAGGVISFTGITPATVELPRKDEYDVFINLAGYQEETVHINKEFDSIYLGNILCGGIIGLIIDASNGAMNKLEPSVINVSLVTASVDQNNKQTYAVFRAMDHEGQLRTLVIPLIKA
jgi:hypothetical protein